MDAWTTGLAALGALLAAIFSGLNLYLSGRREEVRWRREALLDAYDRYLSLSRNRDHVADRILQARANRDKDGLAQLRAAEAKLHEDQLDVLSRLRLLSSHSIIAAAEALHLSDHKCIDVALASPPSREEREYIEARKANQGCKIHMIDEIRKSLRMPGDTRVDPEMW